MDENWVTPDRIQCICSVCSVRDRWRKHDSLGFTDAMKPQTSNVFHEKFRLLQRPWRRMRRRFPPRSPHKPCEKRRMVCGDVGKTCCDIRKNYETLSIQMNRTFFLWLFLWWSDCILSGEDIVIIECVFIILCWESLYIHYVYIFVEWCIYCILREVIELQAPVCHGNFVAQHVST